MECLGGYTFVVMTSVILSGCVKMRAEHGMLREVYIFVMTSAIKKYSRVLDNERMATESNPPFQNGLGSHSPRIRPSRCPQIEIHGCSRLAFSAWHSRRDHVSLAPTRPANKSWSAVSRLRRITIPRLPTVDLFFANFHLPRSTLHALF